MFSGIINTFDQIKIRVAKELVHRMWESLAVCGRRTKALSFCFAKFTWFVSPIHCVDFVDSGQDSLQSLPLEIQPVLWGKGVGMQCDWHPGVLLPASAWFFSHQHQPVCFYQHHPVRVVVVDPLTVCSIQ